MAGVSEERRMKINVQVKRLILEGLSVGARDSAFIQTAVEAELGRRLAQRGIPKDLQMGGSQDRLLAPELRLSPWRDANIFGAQIGEAVYGAFAGSDRREHSDG